MKSNMLQTTAFLAGITLLSCAPATQFGITAASRVLTPKNMSITQKCAAKHNVEFVKKWDGRYYPEFPNSEAKKAYNNCVKATPLKKG